MKRTKVFGRRDSNHACTRVLLTWYLAFYSHNWQLSKNSNSINYCLILSGDIDPNLTLIMDLFPAQPVFLEVNYGGHEKMSRNSRKNSVSFFLLALHSLN
jgi:hypothetical protein